MSRLIEGFIPVGEDCPFKMLCDMPATSPCRRLEFIAKQFSCPTAHAFDKANLSEAEPQGDPCEMCEREE